MATTYLTKTFSGAGNRKKWTWSAWVKKSQESSSSTYNQVLFGTAGSSYDTIAFQTTPNTPKFFANISGSFERTTTALYRDCNGWYHLVVTFDSAQSTAADRLKLYVNGVQQSSFVDNTNGNQNADSYINTTDAHQIGKQAGLSRYFDGVMSHVHFCDGYAYAASAFGSTDSTTGEWKINTSPSVSYGTNGFFILKDGNTITDSSTNSNNWSLGGGTLTKTEDCPSNVFCNFMSHTTSSYVTMSNGGTTITSNTAADSGNSLAGLGASSGKYYFEYKMTTIAGVYPLVGMVKDTDIEFGHQNANGGSGDPAPRIYGFSASNTYNGSSPVSDVSFSAGDIIGIALDLDNGALYASQNGTYLTSGNPTSGASKTGAKITWTPDGTTLVPYTGVYNSSRVDFNFGNGYFGTTAVSSAGTNASNNGIFEYDVPAGYTALSTKGLNL